MKHSRVMRYLGGAAAVLVLAGLVVLGLQWRATLRCEQVVVIGAQHAPPDTLRRLAHVDTSDLLFDIDPVLVADRVQRHPWVQAAEATRLPTGILRIQVQERQPVALVLDRQGHPAHYLDGNGFAMPLVPGTAYDVPLLRGVSEAYHPVRPVEDAGLRDWLAALAAARDETEALVSEAEWRRDGELWLRLTPVGDGAALPVRLGRAPFAPKLERLQAFWRQAVLPRSHYSYDIIDLRFDSQIITREWVRDP